ncbi:MAG: glycosyltransferase [Muribaculaceae bacterium]|nr:glycosyltransferase [Muribaculaceae bacterium]
METARPDISVIVAVYNNFRWLRLVLDSMRMQSYKNFEVVIADDGSSEETVREITNYISRYPDLRIIHFWQKDEGWRKNKCLNEAIRRSSGEYLIFIDGDCIPHPRFIEDHRRLRRKGVVMGGRRVESEKALSDMIEKWEVLPADFFSKSRKFIMGRLGKETIGRILSQLRRTIRFPFVLGKGIGLKRQGILGANFGIYREDIEKVNAFDERYVDPGTGEDTDLDARLENAGIRHIKASHYALMIHRHHKRLFWGAKNNADLLQSVKENGTTYVETGLNQNN